MPGAAAFDYATLDDMALATRVIARDAVAIRLLITRSNQRLFRAAWSILKSRTAAEEVMQDAYLKAFAALPGFRGESALSTWLTRIVVNQALDRRRTERRRRKRLQECDVAMIEDIRDAHMQSGSGQAPDSVIMRRQLSGLLEEAIADLPDVFRLVFVLREVEGLSIAETAEVLGVAEATVKTRLHRAKQRLRSLLRPQLEGALVESLRFAGADCEAMTARVLARLV